MRKLVENVSANDLREITREEVRTQVKRKADDEPHTRPRKIIRTATVSVDNASDVLEEDDFRLLRNAAYDRKRKKFPALPRSYDEAMEQLADSNVSHRGKPFLFFSDDGTIPLLTTAENLRVLQTADHVFGDGTFDCAPRYFSQLYTLLAYMNKFYVLLVFCLLRNKKYVTYKKVWRTVCNLCMKFANGVPHFNFFLC